MRFPRDEASSSSTLKNCTDNKTTCTPDELIAYCPTSRGQLIENESWGPNCMKITKMPGHTDESLEQGAMGQNNSTVEYLLGALIILVLLILIFFLYRKFCGRKDDDEVEYEQSLQR